MIPSDKEDVSALFTGYYDPRNGNALLMIKYGQLWSIPAQDCKPEQPHGKKGNQKTKKVRK